jgi:hypothetical protein
VLARLRSVRASDTLKVLDGGQKMRYRVLSQISLVVGVLLGFAWVLGARESGTLERDFARLFFVLMFLGPPIVGYLIVKHTSRKSLGWCVIGASGAVLLLSSIGTGLPQLLSRSIAQSVVWVFMVSMPFIAARYFWRKAAASEIVEPSGAQTRKGGDSD